MKDVNYRVLGGAIPVSKTAPKMNTWGTRDNTAKTTWDAQPFNLFNLNPSYLTYDKTDGGKWPNSLLLLS